jgi:hypothetical protein
MNHLKKVSIFLLIWFGGSMRPSAIYFTIQLTTIAQVANMARPKQRLEQPRQP